MCFIRNNNKIENKKKKRDERMECENEKRVGWLSKSLSHNYNLLTTPNKLLLFALSKLFTQSKHASLDACLPRVNAHSLAA